MSTDRPSPGQAIRPEHIKRWGPTWSRRVGWFLAHVWWNTTVLGADRVPATGPVLVASNHTSAIDGPLLHGAIGRGSHIIVKEEMFSGVIGFLLRNAGQIPVDRKNGRAALTTALALLNEGRLVGVFPEGTRGRGDVSSTKAGIAWLAVRSGAMVVPVGFVVRKWTQCSARVVIERQQHVQVLGDLRGRLGPLDPVLGRERPRRLLGVLAVLGSPDLGQDGLRAWLGRLRQGVAHVDDLVEPAPLLTGLREDLP